MGTCIGADCECTRYHVRHAVPPTHGQSRFVNSDLKLTQQLFILFSSPVVLLQFFKLLDDLTQPRPASLLCISFVYMQY